MAATFGVNSPALTAPSGGYIHESTSEASVEIATIRNSLGVTVKAVPKNLVTTNLSIKGKGDPALSAVSAGSLSAGTAKIISAKGAESNDDFPDFEISAVKYSTAS